ncbi:MAG: VWA domain-containing protein [Candidatus Koribacter versatilis]|uniref:VWA domain-containing protein n=1 Tax=Candidatus Korobacter versatilis TaxID=658062 RepID=A0A932A9T7_9BACT|nr:VWA domain-containing protein [Candidatus Koribacter versatilis]
MKVRHTVLLVLLALAGALLLLHLPVTHAAPPQPPKPSPVHAAGNGALQILGKDGAGVAVIGECPLKHTGVKAEISGFLARVEVTQEFVNDGNDKIEAVYVFPLPQNAAVNDMTMHVGTRLVRGTIKRREEAAAIYDKARRTGHVAALLDQERPNIFTQSVANILPGETVTITLTYIDTLKYEAGSYEFLFPTVVGPRYIPGSVAIGRSGGGRIPDTDKVPDASRITPPVAPQGVRAGHDISIEVALDAGVPITALRSELHQVDVERTGASSATVRLRDEDTIPNKDFVLRYDVAGAKIADALLVHATQPGLQSTSAQAPGGALSTQQTAGYFTFILQPPDRVFDEDATPRELVFVLDTSGSMSGFPIEKAKETMALALGNLRKNDTFNLITFSGDEHILFPEPVPATPTNLALAQKFLASREGAGGTEMMKAIRAALAPTDKLDHLRIAIFMTDGYVGNDMEIIAEVKKHANARVFAFGIGNSVNRFLLDNMAKEGRGEVEYVTLNSDADAAVARLEERVRTPLLTDVSIDWGGLPVTGVSPARPADLFSAKPLILTGRYTQAAHGTITMRGRRAGQPFTREIAVDLPAVEKANRALATLWARRQVDDLMSQDWNGAQQGNMKKELQEAVTQLGLDYRLMTQFTSFVAVEEMVVTDSGVPRTVQVPVEVPQGVDRAMAVGEEKEYDAARTGFSIGSGAAYAPPPSSPVPAINGQQVTQLPALARNPYSLAKTAGNVSGRGARLDRKDEAAAAKLTGELFQILACLEAKHANAGECSTGATSTLHLRIALTDNSPATLAKLKALGFKLTIAPTTATLVYGDLPAAGLKALAQMNEVFFISRAEPLGTK